MSFNRSDDPSSSSNNNRVEPNFFGTSSRYQHPPKQPESNGVENPYWSNPPPPYSPMPTNTHPLQQLDQPSAPPLETPYPDNNEQLHALDPQQALQQQQERLLPYPPVGYGAANANNNSNNNNNATSDHSPNWPWIAPPSTASPGQGFIGAPPSANPPYPPYYPNNSNVSPKKQKTCCELILKYLFYFFCICLVIRLISLLSDSVNPYVGLCTHGIKWETLPDKFEFGDKGVKIHVVGGHLSGGRIEIKTIDEQDENAFTTGTVTTSVLLSPGSLSKDPELGYSLTDLPNGTTFEIFIPQHLSALRSCISLNAVIYVPKKLVPHVVIEVQNTRLVVQDDILDIRNLILATTNSAIDFLPQWTGDSLTLQTTNGHIDVREPIKDCVEVHAITTNSAVRFRSSIKASELILVETTNGGIDIDTSIHSKHIAKLTTTNSHVNIEKITASMAELKSTNGRLQVNHAFIDGMLNAQTTNSQLKLRIDGPAQPQIIARTTNGKIYTWMPLDYEGTFEIITSRSNKAQLVDELGWSRLEYLEKGHALGTRQKLGHYNETLHGSLEVATTGSDAYVLFALPEE